LETITAALNNVKPLQVMGDRLQLESLKRVNLGNTKNWFEMKDGIITLKPFDVKVGEVALRVGGTYGISTEMNCQVVAKIPKKAFGVAASSGLALLNAEAGKAGISLNQGEFINTRFDISGTMENPKVTMKVLGSDGQSTIKEEVAAIATDYVQKAKDSLNTLAQKELDKAKAQGEAAMKRVKDSLDRVKENLASQLKNQVNNQLKQATGIDTGKGKRDSIGLKVPKTVEEAQKNLEKWNPFQKKKSGN
jgi:alpha-D-ribose 1-methylphosphonate 5-triphosphate synthase subunit PhnG